jgi:hypothetical protein
LNNTQSLRSQLVTRRTSLSLEYIAGFFDGEGCVTVGKNGSLALGIVNTSLPTLLGIQEAVGGSVTSRKQKVNKPQYVWRVYGQEALSVCDKLLPFSLEKYDQLKYGIEWMNVRSEFKTHRIPGKHGRRAHPLRESAIKTAQVALTKMKKEIEIAQQ